MIEEGNYEEKVYSFARKDWQPLIELIPEIESTSKFGKWVGGKNNEEGIIQMPYCVASPVVSKFLEIVYGLPIIISFNWGTWEEGHQMASDESFDFDTVELPVKCKLITAIVRNDRFCEGALVSAFESGLILRLLKSIKKEVVAISK